MSTHLTDQELDGYRARTLAPSRLIAANTHLSSCDQCYERFARGDDACAAAYALMRQELEEGNITRSDLVREHLFGYVDDELTRADRMSFEAHLSGCSPCRLEVADLLGVKEELGRRKTPAVDHGLHRTQSIPRNSRSRLM